MELSLTIDSRQKIFHVHPAETLQQLLQRSGYRSVRNSDDGEGFAGSDTVLIDGVPMYAGLLLAAQADGKSVTTPESLSVNRKLSIVQQSMVDAGVVQSGYNAPAAALLLTELFSRRPNPSEDEITDALSGLFNRATGYKQFYKAAELAQHRFSDPDFTTQIAPEFREDLHHVGKVKNKVDGAMLAAGRKAFVEDMLDDDYCVLKMLRSPYAHAYIDEIETSEAEKVQGVVFIITWKNCPDIFYGQAGQGFPEPSPYDRRMFNRKLRHVGDRVAAVVAETEEAAQKALEAISVTYEPLKPVLSIEEAMKPDAPVIHNSRVEFADGTPTAENGAEAGSSGAPETDSRDGKVIYQFPIGGDPHSNIAASAHGSVGNLEDGFSQADVVTDHVYTTSQIQCTPLETHVVYTKMQDDRVVVHASTQVPWHLRRIVATALGISENKVRVIKERVGGGYGSKQDILLEDVAAYATYMTGRSVLFHHTREEEFIANSTRHPMKIRVKLGAKRDGTITAVYMDVKANTGPFGNHCLTVPMNACSKSLPLILCEHMGFDVTTYYSNIPPTGAYQGYGAPKGSFALMTAVAELASELDMDLLELIDKNRVREGAKLEILKSLGEGQEGIPAVVKSCGLEGALSRGAELIEWGKREQSDDPDIAVGKGLAIIQQGSGLPGLDHSCADIKMLADGSFMLHSGGADLGTGLDTVSVKFAAEVLHVDLSKVSILSGDTDNTPYDTGAYASSGTFFSGSASKKAAEDLLQKINAAAAKMLDEQEHDLTPEFPGIILSRKTGRKLTFKEIAQNTQSGSGIGQLVGYASFTTEDSAFPYGAHFCQVSVNRKTGQITVDKYFALQDCGTPVNPELALGQIYGGVLKSIGHSLYEEMVLNEQGVCLTTTLQSYGVPMITDLPKVFEAEMIETTDPYGPFGSKSVSEISCNGAAPALAAAIHDAAGIWMRDWPFTPEKILRALGEL